MGKEHKKHKKHKHHSKNKHKPKDDEYHVPIVPLKCDVHPKPPVSVAGPAPGKLKDATAAKPIGPVLPPGLSSSDEANAPKAREPNHSYGPSLPPHLVPQKRAPGPSLPLDFKIEEKVNPAAVDDEISGFGPLPAELITSDSEQLFVQKQLELRAEYMKRKFAGEVCTVCLLA